MTDRDVYLTAMVCLAVVMVGAALLLHRVNKTMKDDEE